MDRYHITIIMGLLLPGHPYTLLPTPIITAATAEICAIPLTNILARRRLLHQALPLPSQGPQRAGTMVTPPTFRTLSTTVVRLVSRIHLARDGLVSVLPNPSPIPIPNPNPNAVPLVASPPHPPPLLFMRRLTISALVALLPRFVPAQTVRCITQGQCQCV